jgi:glycerol-3-phosphate acyltransferase PlsX
LLDLGANVTCSSETLISFANIAKDYLSHTHHMMTPKVGILNIGSEAGKGTEVLQETFALLSLRTDIDFMGFLEGDDILCGKAHIIICDGFHGNIALKTMEGTIKAFYSLLKSSMNQSLRSKIGALFLGPQLKNTFGELYNPKKYNGALFMGLNSNAIKSHGSADAESFAYAIKTAYQIAKSSD